MDPKSQSHFSANAVRTNDPDRYVLTMMAPLTLRSRLFALYAFNVEIARIREIVSEPPLGEIRLQWWRDEIDSIYAGSALRHGISSHLRDTLAAHALNRAFFDQLIDARSADLDDSPPDTIADLLRYAEDTTAPLLWLALQIIGDRSAEAREAARGIGIAWSLAGLIRAMPFHLRSHRQYLPREMLEKHGIKTRELLDLKSSDALNQAVRALSNIAEELLQEARTLQPKIDRKALPILLQARYTDIYLRRLKKASFNPFDPQLAVPLSMVAWRLTWTKLKGRY